jgi:ABC-type polysaccharide/polyol phosphate transport system ATPase subunit
MGDKIIAVEGVSKAYKLGSIGTGTLSHDLNQWWNRRVRKSGDPYEQATENTKMGQSSQDWVWSLKDIQFELDRGDVLGVIGNNGAGKSTLLKILSQITSPTRGSVKLNGKLASLLEVGTGFHPELSGRENIFLNGAILGMRKADIRRKFDEIVAFSGIERYLDTPVKRYSSGMFVRLAFSVGAHLEPDILIIDEVLAVGDVEFQQKCLGKMKDFVGGTGRTIIFVSHNLAAVKQLCTKGLVLENGRQKFMGTVQDALNLYQTKNQDLEQGTRNIQELTQDSYTAYWRLQSAQGQFSFSLPGGSNCQLNIGLETKVHLDQCEIRVALMYEGFLIMNISSYSGGRALLQLKPGHYDAFFTLPLPLRDGQYEVLITLVSMGQEIDSWKSSTPLQVLNNYYAELYPGVFQPEFEFQMEMSKSTDYQTRSLNTALV